jgi:hypothetical protein
MIQLVNFHPVGDAKTSLDFSSNREEENFREGWNLRDGRLRRLRTRMPEEQKSPQKCSQIVERIVATVESIGLGVTV